MTYGITSLKNPVEKRQVSNLHLDKPDAKSVKPHSLRETHKTRRDLSARQAFAWVTQPPAATRTARNLVVVANFSDKPQSIDLDAELIRLHLRPGGLRPLLASWIISPPFQYSRRVTLPPFSLLAAEL